MIKSVKIFIWYLNFIQIETTWLDETAEGLKNVIASANRCRNFFDGLSIELLWKAKSTSGWNNIIETMR